MTRPSAARAGVGPLYRLALVRVAEGVRLMIRPFAEQPLVAPREALGLGAGAKAGDVGEREAFSPVPVGNGGLRCAEQRTEFGLGQAEGAGADDCNSDVHKCCDNSVAYDSSTASLVRLTSRTAADHQDAALKLRGLGVDQFGS